MSDRHIFHFLHKSCTFLWKLVGHLSHFLCEIFCVNYELTALEDMINMPKKSLSDVLYEIFECKFKLFNAYISFKCAVLLWIKFGNLKFPGKLSIALRFSNLLAYSLFWLLFHIYFHFYLPVLIWFFFSFLIVFICASPLLILCNYYCWIFVIFSSKNKHKILSVLLYLFFNICFYQHYLLVWIFFQFVLLWIFCSCFLFSKLFWINLYLHYIYTYSFHEFDKAFPKYCFILMWL